MTSHYVSLKKYTKLIEIALYLENGKIWCATFSENEQKLHYRKYNHTNTICKSNIYTAVPSTTLTMVLRFHR